MVAGVKEQIKILSESIVQYQDSQRDSETRRIDQLAETRQEFQNTIRDMLAESVRTTSTLVSTQLVQIQATFDTRVSKLEAAAFTQAGRSSVSDPATANALNEMAVAVRNLNRSDDNTDGRRQGVGMSASVLAQIITSVLAAAAIMVAIFFTRH